MQWYKLARSSPGIPSYLPINVESKLPKNIPLSAILAIAWTPWSRAALTIKVVPKKLFTDKNKSYKPNLRYRDFKALFHSIFADSY